ncbi:MAG TPA: hypothetical protein VHB72_00360 [Candidatus Saccharimonadales bacterium]|nr:hypothetical protein [Candidatus Saccharimonadales bacterium]
MHKAALANSISRYKFKLAVAASGITAALILAFAPAAGAVTIGGPSDCDNNAIIKCGAHSTSEVINNYNASAYVRGVYAYFGISNADINSMPSNDSVGYVTKDGNVFVNGQSKAVATNAITGGRQDIGNSTRVNYQGAIFFVRPPSVSFQQNSLPAFVVMKNGTFQFAVIASCGNAVKATPAQSPTPQAVTPAPTKPKTPTTRTPAPKPAPAPAAQVQQQTQSQNQSVNVTNTQNVTTGSSQPQAAPQQTSSATTSSQPESQPTSLVNTGSTGTIGVFLAAVAAGIFGYRRYLIRRLNG